MAGYFGRRVRGVDWYPGGVIGIHSGNIKMKPDGSHRWGTDEIRQVRGTPWQPDPAVESYKVKKPDPVQGTESDSGRSSPGRGDP